MARKLTLKQKQVAIKYAVLGHFMAKGTAASVHQIAARLGWSETRVRSAMPTGAVPGTKPVHNVCGVAMRGWVYAPELETLRAALLCATEHGGQHVDCTVCQRFRDEVKDVRATFAVTLTEAVEIVKGGR